jgi:hypothetical protein
MHVCAVFNIEITGVYGNWNNARGGKKKKKKKGSRYVLPPTAITLQTFFLFP